MTAIEQTLFASSAAHCVAEFDLCDGFLAITLHPWNRPELATRSTFEHAKVLSVDDSYADAGDRSLPWDVIGFDSTRISGDQWRYCLHTDKVEYCFEGNWPAVRRAGEPAVAVDGPASRR